MIDPPGANIVHVKSLLFISIIIVMTRFLTIAVTVATVFMLMLLLLLWLVVTVVIVSFVYTVLLMYVMYLCAMILFTIEPTELIY